MEVSKLYRDLQRSQHCSSSCTSYVCVLLLVTTIISDTYGQSVTVTMGNAESDVATTTAKMVCEFGIDDPLYTLSNLVWRKGSTTLAHFLGGSADPNYLNYCQTLSPSPCNITRDSSSSQLVLSPVDRARDQSNDYECQVTYTYVADDKVNQASASLVVVVPTSVMTMINGSSLDSFNDGDEVDLSLDVTSHIFQSEVAAINPQATFTWTVGGNQLSSDSITEDHVVDSGTGLTTSTSKAALKPDRSYNDLVLICKAKNYEGDPGVTFRLRLKVADPCVDNKCENGGTCVIDTNNPSMTVCECPVGYKGELCKTAITTTVGPPSTPKPTGTTEVTPTPGPGLQLWIIAVIVIVVVLIAVGVLVCCLVQRKCCCFS